MSVTTNGVLNHKDRRSFLSSFLPLFSISRLIYGRIKQGFIYLNKFVITDLIRVEN